MTVLEGSDFPARIGRIDFTVSVADGESQTQKRPDLAEALARLLLAQWRQEQQDYVNN